jgi:hypothetical protein
MPVLNISRDELGPRRGRATLGYIETIMLWPTDAAQQSRARKAIGATRINNAIPDDAAEEQLTHRQMREVFHFLAGSPPLADIRREARRPYCHGVAAGLVLCEILHRRDVGSRRAQLGAVMDAVAATLAGVGGFGVSRKTIDNSVWPVFRSVSHLWGAHLWVSAGGDRAFPCRLDRLADFLTVTEWFRVEGEGFQPKQSDRTVLDPEETWRMPEKGVSRPF